MIPSVSTNVGIESAEGRFDLGRGYWLHLPHGPRSQGDLYHQGSLSKRVNLANKAERRILVVELLQKNLNQTRLAEVLNLSRQTLHNYRESYRVFGVSGLLHGYSPNRCVSEKMQGRLRIGKRRVGASAREGLRPAETTGFGPTDEAPDPAFDDSTPATFTLEESAIENVLRLDQPATAPALAADAAALPGEQPTSAHTGRVIDRPYTETHDWQASRHAGVFPVLLVLASRHQWFDRLLALFPGDWRIFHLFLLMAARDWRTFEPLERVPADEVGRILGFRRLPGADGVWRWFFEAAAAERAAALLSASFADRIRRGLVGTRLWFTEGHALPYAEGAAVAAETGAPQERPARRRTNLATYDERGRIVCFAIEQGVDKLPARILQLAEQARALSLGILPVQVFAQADVGSGFLSQLVRSRVPFVAHQIDDEQLVDVPASDFGEHLHFGSTAYRIAEQNIVLVGQPPNVPAGRHEPDAGITVRRLVVWNQRSKQRTSVLCWDAGLRLSADLLLCAAVARRCDLKPPPAPGEPGHWGRYRPGFAETECAPRVIANPRCRVLADQINSTEGHLAKLHKQHAHVQPSFNQDGSERQNSRHRRLTEAISASEAALKRLLLEKESLPEQVTVTGLCDYRSQTVIDNEGKMLFDFVTSSVWNVRHQLLDWLFDSVANNLDRRTVLDTILACPGWIRSNERAVVVRLPPLPQAALRYAQEHLCRRLSGLGGRLPDGRALHLEVGEAPG